MEKIRVFHGKSIFEIANEISKSKKQEALEKKIEELGSQLEKLNAVSPKAKFASSKTKPSIAVKLLVLHYLDLLGKIELVNKKKAILLEFLLETEGAENIRIALSNIGGPRSKHLTISNLKAVVEILQKAGHVEALNAAEKDLKKAFEKEQIRKSK